MNSKVKEKAVRRAKKATERVLSLQRRREELEAKKALIWFELLSKCNGTSLLSGSEETVKKVRELCRQGIPPNVRGRVWPLLIGNEEEIGAERFNALKKQADEVRKSSGLMGFGDGADRKEQPSSSGATQVLNVEKGHGLELRKDSLDIGMERLSLGALDIPVNEGSDTNESMLGSSSSSSPFFNPSFNSRVVLGPPHPGTASTSSSSTSSAGSPMVCVVVCNSSMTSTGVRLTFMVSLKTCIHQ